MNNYFQKLLDEKLSPETTHYYDHGTRIIEQRNTSTRVDLRFLYGVLRAGADPEMFFGGGRTFLTTNLSII